MTPTSATDVKPLAVLLGSALAIATGSALWLLRPRALSVGETSAAPRAADAPREQVRPARFAPPPAPTPVVPSDRPERLAADDPRVQARLDNAIPSRLYGHAARCYHGGLQRDQRLDLSYRVHVVGGEVSFSDLQTVDSTLADAQLESCILTTLAAARWRDDELPDLVDEGDLFMRVEGLTRYAQR
jgi:hypothetical protein